jgi:DNA-directed RNA polymerase subunit M/transcription elongation factor TFIIS
MDVKAMAKDRETFTNNRGILPIHFYEKGYAITNDRRSRLSLLDCCLRTHERFVQLPEETRATIIRRIERSCYNHTCDLAAARNVPANWENSLFVHLYCQTTYKVQYNIERKSDTDDPYLIDGIIDGSIDLKTVGSLTSAQLCPSKSEDTRKYIDMRKQQKIVKKYSTQHICPKCGGNKTTEDEIQYRSLDEGSHLEMTCISETCGHTWKKGGS